MSSCFIILIALALLQLAVAYNATESQLYVFAYSWTPEFCFGHTSGTAAWPGCEKPNAYWGFHYTIHGLWPQFTAGGYPSFCTTEAFDTNVPNKVGWSTMTTYWPNVQAAETAPDYTSFWDHEWSKHGTCSGLTQQAYFQNGITLLQKYGTPSSLTVAVGGNISAAQLRTDMGGAKSVALQCTSGKYLNGAYSCWNQANGVPTTFATCPSDVQAEDTCTATTLLIQKF